VLSSSAALAIGSYVELAAGDSETIVEGDENAVIPINCRVVDVDEYHASARAEGTGELITVARRDTQIGPPRVNDRVVIEQLPDGSRRYACPLYTPTSGFAHIAYPETSIDTDKYPVDAGALAISGGASTRIADLPASVEDMPVDAYLIDQGATSRVAAVFPARTAGV